MAVAVVPDVPDWHTSVQVCDAVREFHDKAARQPEMSEARKIHERFTNEIAEVLRKDGSLHRLEYTGSSYEGVKIAKSPDDPDLEFDVMVILRGGSELTARPIQGMSGFFTLRKRESTNSDENILSASFASEFCSKLQKIINESESMKRVVKLKMHGPAIQMDVHKDIYLREKHYSVDMVPTYEVGGCMFVAKPLKGERMDASAWRQSFSLREKEMFDAMDRDNECRKQVLRILKAIRNKEAGLKQLTSFHLKTALFREVRAVHDWRKNQLGVRVLGVLKRLEDALSRNVMKHFFTPGFDLLAKMTPASKNNMRDRIRRLCSSQTAFLAVLQIRQPKIETKLSIVPMISAKRTHQ